MPNTFKGVMASDVSANQTESASEVPPIHNDLYVSPMGMGFGDFIVGDDIDFLNSFSNTSNAIS
jgi:hypothetical protein